MTTSLTTYLTTANSATPGLSSTANILSEVLGTGTAQTKSTQLGTATGYSEIYSRGTASAWQALGSIGSPSGNGWCDDLLTLENEQFLAGTWTPAVRLITTNGTITMDIYFRVYIYNVGAKTYTLINSFVVTGQNINIGGINVTFTGASLSTQNFGVGDRLYSDLWCNVTANGLGNSGTVIKVNGANTAKTGIATSQLVTPGYQLRTSTISSVVRSGRGIGRILP